MAGCPAKPPGSGKVRGWWPAVSQDRRATLWHCVYQGWPMAVPQWLEKQWKGDNGVSFFLRLTFFDLKWSTLFS